MQRRAFLGLATAGLIMAPGIGQAAGAGFEDYTPGLIERHLAEGRVVFVDYYATWCSTCRTQSRIIESLTNANPAYQSAMVFVRVDWDLYGRDPVARSRNIPRRSTLIVVKGEVELGRIVADTSESAIRNLLDLGLNAAS